MKNPDNVKRGKKSRAAGKAFENKVRLDLEKQGWIVVRWDKNVSPVYEQDIGEYVRELIQAKHQFNPFTKSMTVGHGFPDFICLKRLYISDEILWDTQFIECKTNGYLDKEEKQKAEWLVAKMFIPFYVAKKGEKRGEILYEKFE